MTTERLLRQTLHAAADTIEATPPELSSLTRQTAKDPRPRQRRTVALTAAAVLLSATTAGAASQLWDFDVTVINEPEGDRPGAIENSDLFAPGAPFHCTGIFDMTPNEAAALVRDRGFDVTWHYDGRPWPPDRQPPETAYVDTVVLTDENTALLITTPDRRPVRPDRGCPQ